MGVRKKQCSVCATKLPEKYYSNDSKMSNGLRSNCKLCQLKSSRKSITRRLKVLEVEYDKFRR